MATREERRQFPGLHSSNEILSPQPFAPPSKEHLLATFDAAHVPPSDNGSATDGSQMAARDYEYNSSGSSTRHSGSDIFGREMDEDLDALKSRASSRSSFSSMPASVLVHPISQMKSMPPMDLHEKMNGYTVEESEASFGDFDDPPRPMRTIRPREAAFRKPSSVRAMQMHTEDEGEDDDYLTPPRRRAGMRSPGSAALKRSPYYSPNTSPSKQKVKKEYPLVLLHCNLLAPSLPVPAASDPKNQGVVEEVLPAQYWKRWRRLQEKVGSGVIRDRGVLISHPEDLYDMLEERLLESLELQRARVHQGHFLGHEESNPGSEGELSDRGESETDGEQGEECLDCGGRILRHSDTNRKWEIKVFAANGLMRAGAWAAAWKEMEKVDVEVGLWLPSDVRRALEKRMAEVQTATQAEETHLVPFEGDLKRHIMDSRRPSVQEPVRAPELDPVSSEIPTSTGTAASPEQKHKEPAKEIALGTLLVNYIRVLAGDKRNIALVVMTALVAFLATGMGTQQQYFKFQPQADLQYVRGMEAPGTESMSLAAMSSSVALPSSQPSNIYAPAADSVNIFSSSVPVPTPEVQALHAAVIEEDGVPAEHVESTVEADVEILEEPSLVAEASPETKVEVLAETKQPEIEPEEQETDSEGQTEAQIQAQPEEEREEELEQDHEEPEPEVLKSSSDIALPTPATEDDVELAVSKALTEEPLEQPTEVPTEVPTDEIELTEEDVVLSTDEPTQESTQEAVDESTESAEQEV